MLRLHYLKHFEKFDLNLLNNLNLNYSLNSSILSKRTYANVYSNSLFSIDSLHISTAYNYLNTIHDFGLPWWISILSATVFLRTLITLPIYIISVKNAAKLDNLRVKEIPKISKDLQEEIKLAMIKYKWNESIAKSHFHINMKRLVTDLYIKHNCHPLKNLILPLIQIPIWFSLSIAIRQMCNNDNMQLVLNGTLDSLSREGILWFPNLLLPDHFFLPVIMCLTNLFIFEMYNMNIDKKTALQKFGVFFSRSLIFVMLPISSTLPSCVTLYWTCSSFFGLVQNVLFRMHRVRKVFSIPPSSQDRHHFFKDLYINLKNKLKKQ